MTRAYIGLGANLGAAEVTLNRALARIADARGVNSLRSSSFYTSAPVGLIDQPDYINAVAEVETSLTPRALLALLHSIERDLGRERTVRFGPRTCDLDLLLFGEEVIDDHTLTVPHPRMHERRFVLDPLVELTPTLILPNGVLAVAALADTSDQDVAKLRDPR